MFPEIERILIDKSTIARRVREMGQAIASDLEHDLPGRVRESGQVVLIPVMTGAMVFAADLIREMPIKMSLGVVAVSSYPGTSITSRGASMKSELPSDLAGKHVLIVDDILDSGKTLDLLKGLVQEQGAASVRVVALLWKRVEGYEPPIRADYVGFEIPDEFVVGYGLDFDGYYRNYPQIASLKREAIEGAS